MAREGECYGPGIHMKGGNYLTREVIRYSHAPLSPRLPITVLFIPDEEVGTSTRDTSSGPRATNMCWCRARRENNGVVTGRYAIARFNLRHRRRAAGATLSSGCSAIREMARQVLAIDGMTTADCTSPPARSRRPVGQLRRDHLHRRGLEHGQAPG
jgi:glutamate carboxypeptidase